MAEGQYPTTKEIVYLLGMGALIATSLVMPGVGMIAKEVVKAKRQYDWSKEQKTWKKFNHKFLKRNLKRLYDQKLVEIVAKNGQEIIKLTQKGRTKYLKFKLQDISLKSKNWDGKWRLVIYDINKLKKRNQENFRRTLKQMNFWPLQKSVYLTPYECQEEIEYLREYFGLGEEVLLMVVSRLENERIYKEYFGL
ncbi:MAG: hypothetical protein Q8Q15_00160 [bacterium]|nr:hypothetical protein [bacterium]